jgi:hypothetical protein
MKPGASYRRRLTISYSDMLGHELIGHETLGTSTRRDQHTTNRQHPAANSTRRRVRHESRDPSETRPRRSGSDRRALRDGSAPHAGVAH